MKITALLFISAAAVLFCGCCPPAFWAVSVDSRQGGIYQISGDGSELVEKLPALNYLIQGRNGIYYGTANRHPGKKSRYGAVVVLRRQGKSFQVLQTVSAGGITPCHLTLSPDGKYLYTANYSSGDISEFRLNNGLIDSPARCIRHTGTGPTRRQKGPHPHFTGFDPAGKQLFVSDLGTDEIWFYDYVPEKGVHVPSAGKIKLHAGAGPRHLVFSPDGLCLYTANELDSTVSSFERQNPGAPWRHIQTLSTLPSPRPAGRNAPGAIKATRDGRFFFVTNRGHNSLAFFKTAPGGRIHLLGTPASGGNFPSDILLPDNEKSLCVIHLKSGDISFFKLDKEKEALAPVSEKKISVFRGIALCR